MDLAESFGQLVVLYSDRADKCLLEAQAAAIEGNLERSRQLESVASQWGALIATLLEVSDGPFGKDVEP